MDGGQVAYLTLEWREIQIVQNKCLQLYMIELYSNLVILRRKNETYLNISKKYLFVINIPRSFPQVLYLLF